LKELPSDPIAQGRTAEIYLWEDQQVLKLYREWCPSDWVEYESWIAHAIHNAGVPSPAAGEIVEVNGRRGLIYERLDGISMLQEMNARPWLLWRHGRSLADLHLQIHQASVPGLPTYKDRLRHDISRTPHLGDQLRDEMLTRLQALPDPPTLCHGDFHPGNVIVTGRGPVVIDWMTACSGSPWADVARTNLLLTVGPRNAGKLLSPVIRLAIDFYHQAYLRRYLAGNPDLNHEADRWAPFIAAARLSEEITPEREELIRRAKEGLQA
jgi:uncharacterized protein (TIGR02172 family)